MEVAVDCVIVAEGRIALIKRKNEPFKDCYAFPGGFVEDEDLKSAAARELKEETGLTDITLKQFKAYGAPDRDPRGRVITIVFSGELNSIQELESATDAKEAQWFALDDLPPLAFDHKKILKEFLEEVIRI